MHARHSMGYLLGLVLVGCASAPGPGPAPATAPALSFDAVGTVAAVRQAGQALPTELDVQPLRDPRVTDLEERAMALERGGRIEQAAAALDMALAVVPDDPRLLQQRAELWLLAGEPARAQALAARLRDIGPSVGPLCRRNRELLVRLQAIDATLAGSADSASLRAARDACTVTPPPRY